MKPLSENRYFGALFLIPIFLAFILGGRYLEVVITILSLRALYEFYKVTERKTFKPLEYIGYISAFIMYLLFSLYEPSLKIIAIAIFLVTTVTLIYTMFSREHNIMDAAITITGFIYACAYFSLILLIYYMPGGNLYILTIFTISWATDTTAYFVGRLFGKRKLIPQVSPNKTVEGAVGGLFGGALATMIYGIAISGMKVMPWYHFLIMGFVGAIFSQIGDLIASSIKRDFDAKDYPKLIPGHGGILDRFDSAIMTAVSVFLYLTLVVGH